MEISGKTHVFEIYCGSCGITDLDKNGAAPLGGQCIKCPECSDEAIVENDAGIVKVHGGNSIDSRIKR